MQYIKVGSRMLTVDAYKNLTPELINQYNQEAIETARKRKEALDKINGVNKKDNNSVTFDVRPEAIAARKIEMEKTKVILDEQNTVVEVVEENKIPEVNTKEQEEVVSVVKKKSGRPPKQKVNNA